MKAEEAIRYLISTHANMFRSRAAALDLIFCTIGTCMEWIDGEIIDTVDDNYLNASKEHTPFRDFKKEWERCHDDMKEIYAKYPEMEQESKERWKKDVNEENEKIQFVLDNLDVACKNTTYRKFYPLKNREIANDPKWGWCRLAVPDNVKQDWLLTAYETATLIIKTDPNLVISGSKNSNTVEVGHLVIEDLKNRFGDRLKEM